MLQSWASSTDGNLSPLWRSTAFKVAFEEKIHKRHSVGSFWCSSDSIKRQTSLQNTRSFGWEENSVNSVRRLRKKHISVSWWIKFHPCSLEPKSSVCFFRQIQITHKVVKDLLVLINGVEVRNSLLQMSDRNQRCPLLPLRDLHQNRSCHRQKSDFPETLVQKSLYNVGQASLQMPSLGISLCAWIWRWSLLCFTS